MAHAPINERLLIAILTMVHFTHVLDFVIMMPLGPQLMRVMGIEPASFARIVSSYTFAAAASGLLASLVIDRFDRKRALLCFYAGFAIATLACGFAGSFWALVSARIAAGAFGGLIGGLIFAIIGDVVPYQRRGAATGVVMAAFSLASVIGVPIGLWLAVHFGWNSTFIMLAVLSTLVWLIALVALPSMRHHLDAARPPAVRGVVDVLVEPNHLWAFAVNIAVMLSGFMVIPFISPYLVADVGLTEADLPLIYLFGGAFTIVTSRWVGRLADRFGKHRVFMICAASSTVPTLLLTHLPAVPVWVALMCTTLFIVVGSARFVPLVALTTAAVEPNRRGAFMSVNSAIQSLASGVAADLAGAMIVKDGAGRLLHYDRVGWISAAAAVAAVALSVRVRAVGAGRNVV